MGAAINLTPYQGLKRLVNLSQPSVISEAAINLTPYQGLKRNPVG